jgi:hypothetical protein
MMGPVFLLQTIPIWGLGLVATAIGWLVGERVRGPEVVAAALVVGLLCYAAAHTFSQQPGWAAAFVSGLGLAAGVLVAGLPWLASPAVRLAAGGWALALMAAAAGVGRAWPRGLRPLYPVLWIAAWALVIGLVVIQLTGLWPDGARSSAAISAVVFGALAAAWFARLGDRTPPSAGMDLYLLSLNLFLAAAVLTASG